MVKFRLPEIEMDEFLQKRGEEISALKDWNMVWSSENNVSEPRMLFLLSFLKLQDLYI